MKSEKSVAELEMIELLNECETIVDENYLTTNDAKKILEKGYKLLNKCEELRKSRDNWRNKATSKCHKRFIKIKDIKY